jgi:hypothetical protein
MGAIIAAGVVAAGAGYASMKEQEAADERAQGSLDASSQTAQDAQAYIDDLKSMSDSDKISAFGDNLDPTAFIYNPVDVSQSQLDTISGNINATASATDLASRVNSSIWENDLNRIRTLMPGYDSYADSYLGTTASLQAGVLPYSDVMGIIGDTNSLAGSVGTPGGSRSTTLKDLGLSRMDAMNQGNSMFTDFVNLQQTISPVEQQMTAQDSFLTTSERLQADIEQAAMTQQGNSSAEIARAAADPADSAITNAEMAMQFGLLGSDYTPTTDYSGMIAASGVSSAADIFSKYYSSSSKSSTGSTQTASSGTTATAAVPSGWGTDSYDQSVSIYGDSGYTDTSLTGTGLDIASTGSYQ